MKNLSTTKDNNISNPASVPLFTIGVTTYNRPDLLKQTLSSITNQTFSNFEVIVGNDYVQEPLTAESLDIMDSRIRFINHPQNLGEARNMNTLLDLSRGCYFTWQCDDDLYAPKFLNEVRSSLIEFNYPNCVFTAYEFIYGTSYPDLIEKPSKKGQIYTGRQFIRVYWAGKLKAMGCSGVFRKEYLKGIGGVECLADTHHPLYSEHLLLVRAGLQEQVVHIDEPLVMYRIHEDAWGCTTNDLLLYKQASENFLSKSITVLKDPKLRSDFYQNIAAILKFVVYEYFGKARSREGWLSRHWTVPFFLTLRKQFESLRGSGLYGISLVAWGLTGLRLFWWLCTKFSVKAVIAPFFSK